METNQHVISASTIIATSRERAYSILADYRIGHPGILPHQFTSMEVEQGGVGAGTIIRFTMRLLGRTQRFRAAVTEPEPGRVLVETDLETNGTVTSFIVDPGPAPEQIASYHHNPPHGLRRNYGENRALPQHKTVVSHLRS